MWRRLASLPFSSLRSTQWQSLRNLHGHSVQLTQPLRHTAYGRPITLGFLGWLLGSVDYEAVKNDIRELLDDMDHDDGSWGPLFVRLGWHSSGTWDGKTGGSNGATMRFSPECDDPANAGLSAARERLEQVKAKHPTLSYADLWILASYVAIEEMGGPVIDFKAGRKDAADSTSCPEMGRLPDASKGADHVRAVFGRMGFTDEEMVALIGGGHTIGRCHTTSSGFDGPWTRAPTTISNLYFKALFDEEWVQKKWSGPKQFVDKASGQLMMLPTDMVFKTDPEFRKISRVYYENEDKFMKDFASAFKKLTELGL